MNPPITPQTTDAELAAMAKENTNGNQALFQLRLRKLQQFRAQAISHDTSEPDGLRESLGLD